MSAASADHISDDILPGSRVYVRWGNDLVPGFVVDRYRSFGGTRVVVTLDQQDHPGQEASTITVPVTEVTAANDTQYDSPGTWLNRSTYESQVVETLRGMLPLGYRGPQNPRSNRHDIPAGYVVYLPNGQPPILIEIKYWTGTSNFSDQHAETVARRFSKMRYTSGIVVANVPIAPTAAHLLEATRIFAVKWQDSNDNNELERALRQAYALA